MQDYGPHPRHADVDERGTLYGSQEHEPTWVTVHHWCRNRGVYGIWSSGNNQQKGRWILPHEIPTYLEQFAVDGATNDG